MTHILSPNPSTPCPFAWVSLYVLSTGCCGLHPAVGWPGSILHPATIAGNPQLLGEGALPCFLFLVLQRILKWERGRGLGWRCRGVWEAGPRGPAWSPQPAASRPCASELCPSELGPRACPIRGRAKCQRVSRGCFPAQRTKQFWCFQEGTEHCVHLGGVQDSWTDTSALSHATRLISQAPRPPHPRPHPVSLVTPSLQSKHLRRPFQVASGSGHLSHMPLVTGLLGGGRGRDTPPSPSPVNPSSLTLGTSLAGRDGLHPKIGPTGASLEIPWFPGISRGLGTFQIPRDELVSALVPCGLLCPI